MVDQRRASMFLLIAVLRCSFGARVDVRAHAEEQLQCPDGQQVCFGEPFGNAYCCPVPTAAPVEPKPDCDPTDCSCRNLLSCYNMFGHKTHCAKSCPMSLSQSELPDGSEDDVSSFAEVADPNDLAPVDVHSLDESPEFTDGTAYATLCSFWRDRARTKQFRKVGCEGRSCSTLTIDCNTGDDDGTIDIIYARSKGTFFTKSTKYGIFKKHKGINGRFLLFQHYNGKVDANGEYSGEMMMNGCPPWMRHAKSWCEPPKWSKSEDEQIKVAPTETAKWDLQYVWVSWDKEHNQFSLEEDSIRGYKLPDINMVQNMKVQGLGAGVGTMGPSVSEGWYTVGARGWTQACADNDKPKGTDLPVDEDKVCDIDIWKVFPQSGEVIKTTWKTVHEKTVTKKRFEQ